MINGNEGFDCIDCHHFWSSRCRRAITIGKDVSKACVQFAKWGVYDYGRSIV